MQNPIGKLIRTKEKCALCNGREYIAMSAKKNGMFKEYALYQWKGKKKVCRSCAKKINLI